MISKEELHFTMGIILVTKSPAVDLISCLKSQCSWMDFVIREYRGGLGLTSPPVGHMYEPQNLAFGATEHTDPFLYSNHWFCYLPLSIKEDSRTF